MKKILVFILILISLFLVKNLQAQTKTVTGENTVQVEYNTKYNVRGIILQTDQTTWKRYSQGHTNANQTFQYQKRDAWSIYLTDSETKEKFSIDLHAGTVKKNGEEIYQVIGSYALYKPDLNKAYYILTTKEKRIDVAGGYSARGANIIVHSPNQPQASRNQTFSFIKSTESKGFYIKSRLNAALIRLHNFGGKESNIVLGDFAGKNEKRDFRLLKDDAGFVYLQDYFLPDRFMSWNTENNLVMNTKKKLSPENFQFKMVVADRPKAKTASSPNVGKGASTGTVSASAGTVKTKPNIGTVGTSSKVSIASKDVTYAEVKVNDQTTSFYKVSDKYWMSESHSSKQIYYYTIDQVDRYSVFLREVNNKFKIDLNSVKHRITYSDRTPAKIVNMTADDHTGSVYKVGNVKWKMINEEDGFDTPEVYGHVKVNVYYGDKKINSITPFNRSDKGGSRVVAKKGYVEHCSGSMIIAVPKDKLLTDFTIDLKARLADSDSSGNDLIGDQMTVAYPLNFPGSKKFIVLDLRSDDGDIDVSCTIERIF